MIPYSDTETDAAVVADVTERAVIAENSVEAFELPGTKRQLVRLLRGGGIDETLLDPDAFADQPRWKEGTVHPATVPSFIRYVDDHKLENGTTVWVDADAGRFVAVIDDHSPGEESEPHSLAGWGGHRAVCVLKPHPDYVHWMNRDGKLLTQLDFAEHIEQGVHNVVDPAAADLLEVAQTLHGTRNVDWKAVNRLADGSIEFRYEEDLQGRAGRTGDLEIPKQFTLEMAPFIGMEPARFTASFRWRLNDGNVSLGYRLIRPDVVVRNAIDELVGDVEEALGVKAFMGTPRSESSAGAVTTGRILRNGR